MSSFLMSLVFGAVILIGSALVSQGAEMGLCQGSCPGGWTSHNMRSYKYIDTMKDWTDSEIQYVGLGDNLVSAHSERECNFIRGLVKQHRPSESLFWTGLTDSQKEGKWLWSDGSRADFIKWIPQQWRPNNGRRGNCFYGNYHKTARWNDITGNTEMAFVYVMLQ